MTNENIEGWWSDMERILHPMHQEMELAAVWLTSPVVIPCGRKTSRITEGTLLTIEDGKIIDSKLGTFTHRVVACYGNIANTSLSIQVLSLEWQPEIVKLK